MDDDDLAPQSARTNGSGQAVIVNLGNGFRQFALIIGVLVIALIFSCTLSLVAYHQAQEAKTEAAMWAYWGQRVQVTLQSRGIDVPAPKGAN